MSVLCVCVCVCVFSVARSCPTLCGPRDCSRQTSLPMEFSRQEYWSGIPFPTPGDLPNPGIELASPALAGRLFTTNATGKLKVKWKGKRLSRVWLSNVYPKSLLLKVQFSCSVVSDSLHPCGLQHARLLCPSPTPGACSSSCSSSQWRHQTISSFVVPFSSCH